MGSYAPKASARTRRLQLRVVWRATRRNGQDPERARNAFERRMRLRMPLIAKNAIDSLNDEWHDVLVVERSLGDA